MKLICGVVYLDGAQAGDRVLDSMFDALTPPGMTPARSRRIGGPAALGVLDFAAGASEGTLPVSRDGTWLAADLRLSHPNGAPPEDAALCAIRKWDRDAPEHLDGDYALAAWNPARRRLLLARDIMAVRPLCYTSAPGRFLAFASLPKGLHASGVVPARLNLTEVGEVLFQLALQGNQTGWEGIQWLRGGHTLAATPGGVNLHRAWRPDPARVGTWRGTQAHAAAELRARIEDAVSDHVAGAGPVAAHLSGGLDSSTVAILGARHLRAQSRRLYTFSQLARPEYGLRDERDYVNAVLAQEPDIASRPSYLPPLDQTCCFDPDLPGGILSAADDCICHEAARAGANLLLSGAGGDEATTYNGPGLYAALLREGKWTHAFSEVCLRARIEGRSVPRSVVSRLILPFLPLPRRTISDESRKRRVEFLNPDFGARIRASLPEAGAWSNTPDGRIEMLANSYLDARANRWAIQGARHGIAFAYPLVDRRILEFSLSLPIERFLDKGYSRQPFRNAMEGILPESIRWRTSKFSPFPDLPINLAASARGLQARADRLRDHPAVKELFNMDAIAKAFEQAKAFERASGRRGEAAGLPELGQGTPPPWFLAGFRALTALSLAEHVERYG